MAGNGESFGRRAWKVGLTALVGSLGGAALLRNTNWGPTTRAITGFGTGILAGSLAGYGGFPNFGIGLIASGAMVGGGFGATAVSQSGLLTPTAAASTDAAKLSTTTTTSGTTQTSTAGGALGMGDGMRGLGAGRPLVNFQKIPAMTVPKLVAGHRFRGR